MARPRPPRLPRTSLFDSACQVRNTTWHRAWHLPCAQGFRGPSIVGSPPLRAWPFSFSLCLEHLAAFLPSTGCPSSPPFGGLVSFRSQRASPFARFLAHHTGPLASRSSSSAGPLLPGPWASRCSPCALLAISRGSSPAHGPRPLIFAVLLPALSSFCV